MKTLKIIILGAAGFIGTNLVKRFAREGKSVLAIDEDLAFFREEIKRLPNVRCVAAPFSDGVDYSLFLEPGDLVFLLSCHSMPATSNVHLLPDFIDDIGPTIHFLDACAKAKVSKVIFTSSGGTVYGKTGCPVNELAPTNPINSYGVQKLTIEKLFPIYLQNYGLEYVIARIANPYGPYQRPSGKLGVITNFIHSAITKGELTVYGDGSIVRDFIYIDDAVNMLINLSVTKTAHHIYNIGTGRGTSINEIVAILSDCVSNEIVVRYAYGRPVDVPVNYLDISRYIEEFGNPVFVPLAKGIRKTYSFLKSQIEK